MWVFGAEGLNSEVVVDVIVLCPPSHGGANHSIPLFALI